MKTEIPSEIQKAPTDSQFSTPKLEGPRQMRSFILNNTPGPRKIVLLFDDCLAVVPL